MFLRSTGSFARIVLFFVVMLAVAWVVPYEDLVDTFTYKHINYSDAEKIAKQVLGEPDPEPYDSISDYISFVINTLISVPLMGLIISAYNAITRKTKPSNLPKEWAFSTLRRFGKIALFTFLLWVLLRLLPYDVIFPAGETYSNFVMTAAFGFHLLSAVFGYRFITKIIKSDSKTP